MTGGRQQISLAGGCWHAGIVAHEIGESQMDSFISSEFYIHNLHVLKEVQ